MQLRMHLHYAGISALALSDAKRELLQIEGRVSNFKRQGIEDAQFTDANANGPMISVVPFFMSANTDGVSCLHPFVAQPRHPAQELVTL